MKNVLYAGLIFLLLSCSERKNELVYYEKNLSPEGVTKDKNLILGVYKLDSLSEVNLKSKYNVKNQRLFLFKREQHPEPKYFFVFQNPPGWESVGEIKTIDSIKYIYGTWGIAFLPQDNGVVLHETILHYLSKEYHPDGDEIECVALHRDDGALVLVDKNHKEEKRNIIYERIALMDDSLEKKLQDLHTVMRTMDSLNFNGTPITDSIGGNLSK